jgi:hypothetical protein
MVCDPGYEQCYEYENRIERLCHALRAIKTLCAGDKIPNWKNDWATTTTRGRIMDLIDVVVPTQQKAS